MGSANAAADPAEAVTAYLADRSRVQANAPAGLAKKLVKRVLPDPLHGVVRAAATDALAPWERRRAARAAHAGPLRLHLGSGHTRKQGWVNVDLLLGAAVDLGWNLRRPLPFADGSVDAIFHEHLLEHLPLAAGVRLVRESRRVLRPGGVLRMGVPDAGAYVRSCADGGRGFIEHVRPGRPTPLLALQEAFYVVGHRTMYDFETLELVCRAAGFERVERREFGDSRLEPCPDTEDRRPETLYVELVR